jgi:hypothetical protein
MKSLTLEPRVEGVGEIAQVSQEARNTVFFVFFFVFFLLPWLKKIQVKIISSEMLTREALMEMPG